MNLFVIFLSDNHFLSLVDVNTALCRLLTQFHTAKCIPCVVCCGIAYGWSSRDACWCPGGGNILAGVFAITLCSGNLIILGAVAGIQVYGLLLACSISLIEDDVYDSILAFDREVQIVPLLSVQRLGCCDSSTWPFFCELSACIPCVEIHG